MLRENIDLDYIFKNLEIFSNIGKEYLKNLEFIKDKKRLEDEYDRVEQGIKIVKSNIYPDLKRKLKEIKGIDIEIARLENRYILDDVELFRIKIFTMIYQQIKELLIDTSLDIVRYDLNNIIKILDPDGLNIASFQIYSSYSEELSEIRKKIKAGDNELIEYEKEIEDCIRKQLSAELLRYTDILKESMREIGYLDFLLSKSKQSIDLNLTRATIGDRLYFKGMYNPKLYYLLESKGKKYQKIDIELNKELIIITGANMSGKTITLKTVGLIQNMAQYGFYIPVEYGEIFLVDDIYTLIGDTQSLEEGISSFAGEILQLDKIVKDIKNGIKSLVLIDELARTTNPQEGRAIVNGVIDILKKYEGIGIITTHYDNVGKDLKKLRVNGIKKDIDSLEGRILEECIDYSLVEVKDTKVPEEALRIAKLLKIDNEIVESAYKYLS